MKYLDLELIKARSKKYNLHFTDSSNNNVNITGCKVFFVVKRYSGDDESEALINIEVTNHVSPSEGKTTVLLNYTDTDIDVMEYDYELMLINTTIEPVYKETILKGRLNLVDNVKKR